MKPIAYCIILFFCVLTSGCVRRTVSVSHANNNLDGPKRRSGTKAHSEVIEEKTIWIWQSEYRNR